MVLDMTFHPKMQIPPKIGNLPKSSGFSWNHHEFSENSWFSWFSGFYAKRGAQTTSFPKGILSFPHSADFSWKFLKFLVFLKNHGILWIFMFLCKNHVSAWQCSPELSISPRSHETVQNIRRDLMYGGVGAANFHEFHLFSWNSLNSPKCHRISWFCLNFMKFMKIAEISAKKYIFSPGRGNINDS